MQLLHGSYVNPQMNGFPQNQRDSVSPILRKSIVFHESGQHRLVCAHHHLIIHVPTALKENAIVSVIVPAPAPSPLSPNPKCYLIHFLQLCCCSRIPSTRLLDKRNAHGKCAGNGDGDGEGKRPKNLQKTSP